MERIAVVLGKMNNGGVESVVTDYYLRLDYSRYQFDFFVDQTSLGIPYSTITERGGRVFLLPPMKKIIRYKKALTRYLLDGKYKILHTHLNTLSVVPLRIAKKVGIPVRISHNHSTSHTKERVRHLTKIVLRSLSNKYPTSRFACTKHAGVWLFGEKQYKKGNITVINNAIDLERFKFNPISREELRKNWGYEDNFVIGNIGRFVPQKNQLFLIDIFYKCQKLNDKARLVLVGEGKLEKKIIKKIKKYQIEDKVKIVRPTKYVEKFYSAFDCLAFPSIYEGLGRVVVEAQASGLYSVCSIEVPKDVLLSPSVKFVSRKNKTEWVNSLLSLENQDRQDFSNEIKEKGYDISVEVNSLMNFYDKSIENLSYKNKIEIEETKPLISILIAAYNVEKFIGQCIDSAINQTYSNIEVLVVNDGSTDSTSNIINRYLDDSRVRVINQANKGLSEVRNVAIKQAKGEYVVFIDGDDFVSPYYVENLYDALVKSNASMSCSNFVKYHDNDKFPIFEKAKGFRVLDRENYLKAMLYQQVECTAWGKLYKKELAQKLVYPKGALYEDLAVFPLLVNEIKTVALVSVGDYVYRQNARSIVHKQYNKSDKASLTFMDNLTDYTMQNFPQLFCAVQSRKFSIYCNLYLRLNKKDYPKEYYLYWGRMKQMRAKIIQDKCARKKNRLGAFLTYFGSKIFRIAYRLV